MTKLYVDKELIDKSINYFKSLEAKKIGNRNVWNFMGLFLIFKKLGFSIENKIRKEDFCQKNGEKYNQTVEISKMLGGIFAPNETDEKYGIIFPFGFSYTKKKKESIHKDAFFNPACKSGDIPGRISDTMDNSLIDPDIGFLRRYDISKVFYYSFKQDYLEAIKKYFDSKINLKMLSIWLYRFTPIEIPESEKHTIKNLTVDILIKKFLKDFYISNLEIETLFEFDNVTMKLSLNSSFIEGNSIRNHFIFDSAETPQIDFLQKDELNEIITNYTNIITLNEVLKFMSNSGDNLSINEINKILENKKQIILHGAPGTGKTMTAKKIAEEFFKNNYRITQFHPDYSYQDFIGGTVVLEGKLINQSGLFLNLIMQAIESEDKFLLIIDEINRGNLS